MREFSNHTVLSMSDSTMAVSSRYTQDLSVQIVFFTFTCKWFLCFYFWAVIWSYIVDLFAALHELAPASWRTLLKLASSVRAIYKPYGDTLSKVFTHENFVSVARQNMPCGFSRREKLYCPDVNVNLITGKAMTSGNFSHLGWH